MAAAAHTNPFHEQLYSKLENGRAYYNIQKLNDERIKQVRLKDFSTRTQCIDRSAGAATH